MNSNVYNQYWSVHEILEDSGIEYYEEELLIHQTMNQNRGAYRSRGYWLLQGLVMSVLSKVYPVILKAGHLCSLSWDAPCAASRSFR
ncbi:hypothetical protein PsorP6_009895 [Peronosclerospora sorghi]|uniref:Uncharacterized protein n=1 Tax=Peronosclerospora sorghi TaxID=230839 RepID=A0ACC0VYM1_9STRA|nr:hypothetical protein PsorP6_009895 [Peronosclerospora sorghi]